jgi:hypothetical protein
MEWSKPSGQVVELWGEGHGFADGASRLTGTTDDRSTLQILQRLIPQAIASTGEMWIPDLKGNQV